MPPPASKPNAPLNPQQLRKLPASILRDQARKTREQREEDSIKDQVSKANKQSSSFMLQLYLVIGTAIIITICAGLNYTRPRFLNKLFKRSKPIFSQPCILHQWWSSAICHVFFDVVHCNSPKQCSMQGCGPAPGGPLVYGTVTFVQIDYFYLKLD